MAKEKKVPKKDVVPEDRTKLGKQFTRYINRNEEKTIAEKGVLLEKRVGKEKVYQNGDVHSTDENSNSHPLVIVKLRCRGYTVVDVARNTFYIASEVKLNDKCTVYCHNAGWSKKGKFFLDTDKRPGLPVKDENGNLILIEHDGVLKHRFKDKNGKTVIEESPIPAGFVYTVTA